MTKDFKNFTFAIIKHYNSPNEAVTMDGHKVTRQDKIFFTELGRFVKCAPYDTHFIYDDPEAKKQTIGRWTPMCSCGSPAGIVGYNAYRQDASPSSEFVPGELIVCLSHAQFGRHANGVQ